MLAAANLLSFVGVFLASAAHGLLAQVFHLSPRPHISVWWCADARGRVYAVILLPDSLLRFVLWLLTRTVYRSGWMAATTSPARAGRCLSATTGVRDAIAVAGSTDRPIRFMIYKGMYEKRWVKPFARILGAIPISSELRPREDAPGVADGGRGNPERRGGVHFRGGPDHAHGPALAVPARVRAHHEGRRGADYPVALDGVWGSIFSFQKGRFLWKLPRRIPYRVTVNFGKALPHTAAPFGGAGARAGTAGGSLGTSEGVEAAAPRVCAHGPMASIPAGDVRRGCRPK